jgi:NAD(P)H-flavin reductase
MMTSGTVSAPSNPWLTWNARIVSLTLESPGVATYDIAIEDAVVAEQYRFMPGQFNMLYVPGIGEAAISISGDSGKPGPLAHTIREAGNVTQALARMGSSAAIGLRGPFGTGWPMHECEGKDVILVAGGIGMAPLRPVVYSMLSDRARFGDITLLMGARTPEGLLYPDEWASWMSQIDVQQTVDRAEDNWQGHVGVVTSLLERLAIPRPQNTILMTCGPEVMMRYTIRSVLSRDVPKSSVWLSMERNMNCAVGFCGHCQLGPDFVCKDGPVLRYDRVAPFLKVNTL